MVNENTEKLKPEKDVYWREVDELEYYQHIKSEILAQTDIAVRITSIAAVDIRTYRDRWHNETVKKWAFLNLK